MYADGISVLKTEDGQTQIDVRLENDTVWLTQAQMAELFQKDQSVIARHINNALKEGELEENSNMHFLHNTQYKYRPTKIYDLDTIICVGYRVHSKRGTAFRIWARKVIKDYLVKGYPDPKGRDFIRNGHIFKTTIAEDTSWIIISETIWGECWVHSISDDYPYINEKQDF